MWNSKLTRRQKIRRWAGSLWATPLMLFPVWVAALYEPGLILEYPKFFLLFFGLPFIAAVALYAYAASVDRSEKERGSNHS